MSDIVNPFASRIYYPKELFALFSLFAEKASRFDVDVSGPSELLSKYTPAMRCLGFGRNIKTPSAEWVNFSSRAPIDRPYENTEYLYNEHLRRNGSERFAKSGRYFWYEIQNKTILRIHFENDFNSCKSPLSNIRARREELRNLILAVGIERPLPSQVIGRSWLYCRQTYRSLFPSAYIERMQILPTTFDLTPRMSLWGQLLRFDGTVKYQAQEYFLTQLAIAHKLSDLTKCFEMKVNYLEWAFADLQTLFTQD